MQNDKKYSPDVMVNTIIPQKKRVCLDNFCLDACPFLALSDDIQQYYCTAFIAEDDELDSYDGMKVDDSLNYVLRLRACKAHKGV